MAKKKQNSPAAPNPDSQAQAPIPGPAPSAEEIRRLHVETNARDRFQGMAKELDALIKGDLKKTDRLQAIIAVGESVMSVGLHTRGRFRCLAGRGDASLESKAAYIKSCLRKAGSVFDTWDTDMSAWSEFVECLKPVVAAAERTVKDLDRPGVKAAVAPGGEALFDEDGDVTERAAVPPAPAPPTPEPGPCCNLCGQTAVHADDCAYEGAVGDYEEQPPAPAPLQTLGMNQASVIDVDVVEDPPEHPLDGMSLEDAETVVQELMDDLEEAGIENGLKRKDWKAAEAAWMKVWPEDCGLEHHKMMFDRLTTAMARRPITWAVAGDPETFAHMRKLAVAAGE